MVDEKAVQRTHGWVAEALARRRPRAVRGEPDGRLYPPTVLVDVPRDAMVCGEEAFAPVVNLFAVPTLRRRAGGDQRQPVRPAVRRLHASTWSGRPRAHDELEVGGVIVNDVPTWRTDAMPYGGVKDSGLGREGLRWSIEDMTEPRLLAFARPL